jgi:hypothetical protein
LKGGGYEYNVSIEMGAGFKSSIPSPVN